MQRDHIRPSVCALRCTSAKVAIKKERERIECQGFPPPFAYVCVCIRKRWVCGSGNSTPPFRIAESVPHSTWAIFSHCDKAVRVVVRTEHAAVASSLFTPTAASPNSRVSPRRAKILGRAVDYCYMVERKCCRYVLGCLGCQFKLLYIGIHVDGKPRCFVPEIPLLQLAHPCTTATGFIRASLLLPGSRRQQQRRQYGLRTSELECGGVPADLRRLL